MRRRVTGCVAAVARGEQLVSLTHLDPVQRIDHAERFFAATGADIGHGGNQAYYSVTHDRIQMPPFETFRDAESYYATLAHECTHWTRHAKRLDREFGRKQWGDQGDAREGSSPSSAVRSSQRISSLR